MEVTKRAVILTVFLVYTALLGVISNSILTCRICVFILLILCIIRGSREKCFLNPFYLFSIVPFSLLIYANISRYHLELTINTWLIAIINIATFIIAVDLTPNYKNVQKCIGLGEDNQLIYHTIFFLALTFFPSIYMIIFGKEIPLSSEFALFSSAAIVCALKSKNSLLISVVLFVSVLSWIGYTSKSTVLTFIFAILIGYEKYWVETPVQKRKLMIFTVFGLLLIIFAFSFANQNRGSLTASEALRYYTRYGGVKWKWNPVIFMPYMYLTTPWANLQYVMETQSMHTYGLWLLKPLIGYLQIDKIFEHFYNLTAYSSFNTFTYLAVCFKDFGLWGSCISSAFLGFFTKKIYSRFLISKSPLDVSCYVLVAQAVAEMFFSNHFFSQSYPFTIVIIMGIYKLIFCRDYDEEIELSEDFEYDN